MLNLLGNVVRGFIMGAADVVPGVSGGTVALVLGIYRRLISSVRDGAKVLGRLV
jgi:putative membrane protein